ncbi:hypothetical protein Peur_051202 [Populus x canadensis]
MLSYWREWLPPHLPPHKMFEKVTHSKFDFTCQCQRRLNFAVSLFVAATTVLPDEVAPQPELVGVNSMVVEVYDPARPNDYEDYRREKKRKAMEAERLREIERRRQEKEEEEEEEERERKKEKDRDRDVNIYGEEAWRRHAAMSGGVPRSSSPRRNTDGFSIRTSGTVRKGKDWGKQEQGITTPLMTKKTDRRAGVIVNASEKKVKSVNFNGTPPTQVLLLRQ